MNVPIQRMLTRPHLTGLVQEGHLVLTGSTQRVKPPGNIPRPEDPPAQTGHCSMRYDISQNRYS